jgi:hypothetical protein
VINNLKIHFNLNFCRNSVATSQRTLVLFITNKTTWLIMFEDITTAYNTKDKKHVNTVWVKWRPAACGINTLPEEYVCPFNRHYQ